MQNKYKYKINCCICIYSLHFLLTIEQSERLTAYFPFGHIRSEIERLHI